MSMLAAAAAALTITVRVYDLHGVAPDLRAKALALAGETLAKANVIATWVDCTRHEDTGVAPVCLTALGPGEIVLRFQGRTERGPHILGTAVVQVDGPCVVASVYAESVAERSVKTGVPQPIILGRVTAHEIGHLLLGANSHSPNGLMRASWNLRIPHPSEWEFTDEDAARIRSRMLAGSEAPVAALVRSAD
jgi:hypothetical protein